MDDTAEIVDAARVLAESGRSPKGGYSYGKRIDRRGLPPSLTIDHAYAPTPITRHTAAQLLASSPQFDITGPGSYVVRAFVDHTEIDHVHHLQDTAGNPRIFADPAIGLVPAAFGDPPIGTALDVSRLLGQGRLNRLGMDGSGVAVALIDNGINLSFLNSRGLQPKLDIHASWSPNETVVPGAAPVDHGCMCAYDVLITAPQVTLLDYAVARTTRQGGSAMDGFLSDAIIAYGKLLGLMMVADEERSFHSLVVNNSWAVFSPDWDFPPGSPGRYIDNPDHPFHAMVANLSDAGADIVFAAGNCGDAAPDRRCGFSSGAPRITGANSYTQVITVAGVDINGNVAGYSSPGPGSIDANKPDIAAYTHFKGSEAFGIGQPDAGTSAAAPVMSGVVAALRSRYPFVSGDPSRRPEAIKSFLLATAVKPAGVVGFSNQLGNGVVDTARFENPILS